VPDSSPNIGEIEFLLSNVTLIDPPSDERSGLAEESTPPDVNEKVNEKSKKACTHRVG
jgi:hypothetical protein